MRLYKLGPICSFQFCLATQRMRQINFLFLFDLAEPVYTRLVEVPSWLHFVNLDVAFIDFPSLYSVDYMPLL